MARMKCGKHKKPVFFSGGPCPACVAEKNDSRNSSVDSEEKESEDSSSSGTSIE
jgi:hypothetical protein